MDMPNQEPSNEPNNQSNHEGNHEQRAPRVCHESHGAHHKSYWSQIGPRYPTKDPTKDPTRIPPRDIQGIPQRIDKGLERIRGNLESSHNFNIISELNVISAIQWREYCFSINKAQRLRF